MTSPTIRFSKMHGLGNDFVVIDTIRQKLSASSLPAAKIAHRHLGIGCDQILVIGPSENADFFCRILNSDGSEAEQCGNGLRCVARYVHEQGLHTSKNLRVETVAGHFPIEIQDYDHIRVALTAPGAAPTPLQIPLPTLDATITGSALSLGNPHFIVKVNDLQAAPTSELGRLLSTHSAFPHGTNVGFVEVLNQQHIRLKTYERGAGETHACGSNACAAVLAGIMDGSLSEAVDVEFKYGKLVIGWKGQDKPVYMTGPATFVYTGDFSL